MTLTASSMQNELRPSESDHPLDLECDMAPLTKSIRVMLRQQYAFQLICPRGVSNSFSSIINFLCRLFIKASSLSKTVPDSTHKGILRSDCGKGESGRRLGQTFQPVCESTVPNPPQSNRG